MVMDDETLRAAYGSPIDPRTGPNTGERIIATACSGDPVPGGSYGFLRSSLQVGEAEEWRRQLDNEEKQK